MRVDTLNLFDERVSRDTSCGVVYDLFAAKELLPAIAIVDDDVPVGLVIRSDFVLKLADKYGRPLFENKPVDRMMESTPRVFAHDMSVDEVSCQFAMQDPTSFLECFIVTRNQKLFGVGNGHALIAANVHQTQSRLDELERAKAKAEAANEAKSKFLAIMSHEIGPR